MKQTGPPRKPTALKILQGSFRPHLAAPHEPKPEIEIPPVPAQLSDEAKVEWGRISQELVQLGLLTRIDQAQLAAYCEFRADFLHACTMCQAKDGQDRKVIKTAAGNFVENPYYSIKKRSAEMMHKFATEFGLSPASRTRINAEPVEPVKSSNWKGFGTK